MLLQQTYDKIQKALRRCLFHFLDANVEINTKLSELSHPCALRACLKSQQDPVSIRSPNTFNSFRFQVSIGSDTFNTFHHQASSGNAKRQQNGANNKSAKANYLRQATLAQYSEKSK